jgi:hypothetical protein
MVLKRHCCLRASGGFFLALRSIGMGDVKDMRRTSIREDKRPQRSPSISVGTMLARLALKESPATVRVRRRPRQTERR